MNVAAKMVTSPSSAYPDRVYTTKVVTSSDPREVREHLAKNCVTMGFSVQYAVNPTTGEVVSVFTKGKLTALKHITPLVAAGFTEWHFSWAWASEWWSVGAAPRKLAKRLDLTTWADVAPWVNALRGTN